MRHLYTARFAVVNIVAAALLVGAALEGWLAMIVEADQSRMTLVISAVFLYGLISCGARISRLSRFARRHSEGLSTKRAPIGSHSEDLKMRLLGYQSGVRHIANSLVLLGLIGTVVGFVIAFGHIDPRSIGDADLAAGLVAQVLDGMGVALYTTLVGAVAHIWLYGCYKILDQACTAAWLGDPC